MFKWLEDRILNYNAYQYCREESDYMDIEPLMWCSKHTSNEKIIKRARHYGNKATHIAVIHASSDLIIEEIGDGILSQREDSGNTTLGWSVWRDLLEHRAYKIFPIPKEEA